jgi:agmatine/peptidylarginine deiminase
MRKNIILLLLALSNVAYGQKYPQRWNIKPTQEEIEYRRSMSPVKASANKTTAEWQMPAGARFPGEFEESQAVCLTWPYDYQNPGDVDVSSYYGHLWADMADAIQKECAVWIRITDAGDEAKIRNFMTSIGKPLTNARFFVTVADDFWVRDFGPLGFYYDGDDKIGFLDMKYYEGRDNDNLFPTYLGEQLGYKNVMTNLHAEGGNYITDGFGKSFYSSVVTEVNGSMQAIHSPWTANQTKDTLKYVWASREVHESQTLQCDGGTGHNDMYMKLVDETTFAIMEYPSVVTAPDKKIIDQEIAKLLNTKTVYNTPYRVLLVPMPTGDDGKHKTSCGAINNDARTYVNGTTVNKTYLMPIYSDDVDGNKAADEAAITRFKKIMPGYKIVPLDARGLTVLGGAVHCVNMQIPAENPIHFWHPPIQDIQPLLSNFHIVSKITNKSGIASAACKWRINGGEWNNITLADSAGYWIGDIRGKFGNDDVIEYYLSANSNNGKTMTKPITADSGGYYSFFFHFTTSVAEMDEAKNFVMNPVPNPTTGEFYIPIVFEGSVNVEATVVDIFGKKVSSKNYGRQNAGMNKLDFNLEALPAGMYFIHISANGQLMSTKKVSKQ